MGCSGEIQAQDCQCFAALLLSLLSPFLFPPRLPRPPSHYLEPRVLCMLGQRAIFGLYPWVPTVLQ